MPEKIFKVAIVHDWLVTYAGAERVLEQILICFPQADVFSVVEFLPNDQRAFLSGRKVNTTFIQRLPLAKKLYRFYLPLMPIAIEQLDVTGYDVVISSSHAVSKGVLTGPDQLFICLCHSPMRYAWDLQHEYLKESGLVFGFRSFFVRWILHKLRIWDVRSSNGVDKFIAISKFISRRIDKTYRRSSEIIYPPVDVDSFDLTLDKSDFYVTASRMVPYKKLPMIVEAFKKMPNKKLIVIGEGPDFDRCKRFGAANIQLMGRQSFPVLKDHLQKAKAFIFAAEEDFGIAPLEAQACGTPVIAFGKGGALETIRGQNHQSPTGVFFYEQTSESLIDAVALFEQNFISKISPQACRENANRFSQDRFRRQLTAFVNHEWNLFKLRMIDG
jgi:glycosyltransferase involved in cell wall biosynthesis